MDLGFHTITYHQEKQRHVIIGHSSNTTEMYILEVGLIPCRSLSVKCRSGLTIRSKQPAFVCGVNVAEFGVYANLFIWAVSILVFVLYEDPEVLSRSKVEADPSAHAC